MLRGSAAVTPGAHAACVYVDETGPWIVAHTAAAEPQCGIPQRESINAGDANIDGVCLHVQAAPGDTRRAGAKELVAPGSPVTADNLNFRSGMTDGRRQVRQDVECARVVVLYFSCAVIAKEIIKLLFGFRKEGVAAPVDDVNALACVRVIQAEAMNISIGGIGRRCSTGRQ